MGSVDRHGSRRLRRSAGGLDNRCGQACAGTCRCAVALPFSQNTLAGSSTGASAPCTASNSAGASPDTCTRSKSNNQEIPCNERSMGPRRIPAHQREVSPTTRPLTNPNPNLNPKFPNVNPQPLTPSLLPIQPTNFAIVRARLWRVICCQCNGSKEPRLSVAILQTLSYKRRSLRQHLLLPPSAHPPLPPHLPHPLLLPPPM